MERIVVLGAEGMLGHDLLECLGEGYDLIGFGKEDLDITCNDVTRRLIKEIAPDIVIHAAGYTDVDGCEKCMQKAFAINGEGAKNVAKGCRLTGAKLVYISTDYIFDGEKSNPYSEDDFPNPQNIYGESKLLGERYIEDMLDDYLIVRTQWLYGKYGRNFIETILALAEERERIEVVNDQIGSPTYTMDLSKSIGILLSKDLKGIFHISNSGSCSWHNFALEIVRLADIKGVKIVPIPSSELNRPAKRPLYSVFSCQKLQQQAGIDMRTWKQALKDYFHHRERAG